MAFERNNTAGDFETMLRRHIEHTNRVASACSEFDAEVASTYLEGGLPTILRSHYESHLAGCTACRHALVTLHRLAPATVSPAASADRPLNEWWQSIKEGLGLQGWRYGLVATASVVIVLVGVYTVRRQSLNPPAGAIAMVEKAPESQVTLATTPSGTSSSSNVAPRPELRQTQPEPMLRARVRSESKALGEPPLVAGSLISGRVSSAGGIAVAEAEVVLVDSVSQQERATTRTDAQGQFKLSARPEGNYLITVQAEGYAPQQIADVRPVTAQELDVKLGAGQMGGRQMTAAAPQNSKSTGTMKQEQVAQRQDAPKASDQPTAAASASDRSQPDAGARRLAPREIAKGAKAQPTPTPRSSEDENFHALVRKVRDKTFRFDRGVWIDQDYKPENGLQRVRLSSASAEYDRVLTDIPSLAPFFDLGQVIVIWQGKVYEVRK